MSSEYNKPNPPNKPTTWSITDLPSAEEIKKKAEEARKNVPPEYHEPIDKTAGFVARYHREIVYGLIALIFLRVYKKKISRATAKQVVKTLEKAGQTAKGADVTDLYKILEELRATPGMAYIPHGGGMVHLLKGRDAIITVFGDFDRMDTEEIWNQVAKILNLGVKTR